MERDYLMPKLAESILNVSIAGFGGVLVGISLSRKGSVSSLANMSARNLSRRKIPDHVGSTVDHDLPILMGASCATFGLVIETIRISSPSRLLMNYIPDHLHFTAIEDRKSEMSVSSIIREDEVIAWTDYTIGGALAGGIFRQIAMSTRTKTAERLFKRGRLPSMLGTQMTVSSGFITGAMLGFGAGFVMVCIDRLQTFVKYMDHPNNDEKDDQLQKETEESLQVKDQADEQSNDINLGINPADESVRNLSAKQLRIRIEELQDKRSS